MPTTLATDAELQRMEEALAACEREVDECMQRHFGAAIPTFAKYLDRIGAHRFPDCVATPPLPIGYVDAAELRTRLTCEEAPEVQRLSTVQRQLEAMEQVALHDLPSFGQDKKRLREEHEWLAHTLKMRRAEELRTRWSLLVSFTGENVVVVDGVRFRGELSALLKRKLDLLCQHRLAVAERVVRARAQSDARDTGHRERIDEAAKLFQGMIAHALDHARGRGGTTYLKNVILPLRHEYVWQAHFPSLFECIPTSLPENTDLSPWLTELSLAIERDRAAALAAAI